MIKGCLKKVIVVKDTGSDLFDEAYFIVSAAGTAAGGDLLCEAKKIIAKKDFPVCRTKHGEKWLMRTAFAFLLGALAVAVPGLIIFL